MFTLLASLYFYDKYNYLHNQSIINANIEQIECLRANLVDCQLNIKSVDIGAILLNIFYAFLVTITIFIPISIYLSKYAIKPYKVANDMIDKFIKHIVHDLNSPLSNIKLNISLISQKFSDKALDRIKGSIEQLVSMQHELLSLMSNQSSVKKNHINLTDIINETIEDVLSRYKGATINTHLEDISIFANEIDIKRILYNLLSNSIKYNRDNNPIKVILTKDYLLVEDRGIGIKDINRVFNLNSRERLDIEGSGIGLSAVVSMAKRNNIDIKVNSKVGFGTSIKLIFNTKKVI